MRCARYAVQLSILAAVLALGAGCPPPPGEGPGAVTGVTPDGKPVWVRKGSGKYNGAHGVAFYGVGIVQGIRNPSLARQTADNRARGAIASMFHSYIAKMMKDYQRSTTAGNFQASAEEQDVVAAQKTITEVTLRGVEIRDHADGPPRRRAERHSFVPDDDDAPLSEAPAPLLGRIVLIHRAGTRR